MFMITNYYSILSINLVPNRYCINLFKFWNVSYALMNFFTMDCIEIPQYELSD